MIINFGKYCRLTALRISSDTVYLDGLHLGDIELPLAEAPEHLHAGMEVTILLTADSEGYPLATTRMPKAIVGDIAWLPVLAVDHREALLDWGLPQALRMPLSGLQPGLKAGDHCLVKIIMDEFNQISATENLADFVEEAADEFSPGQSVSLLVTGMNAESFRVVIDNRYWGSLPVANTEKPLYVGQRMKGWVRATSPEGQVEVTLKTTGHEQLQGQAQELLLRLQAAGGFLPFHDKSDHSDILRALGMSKSLFRQALGELFRRRLITLEADGIRLSANPA